MEIIISIFSIAFLTQVLRLFTPYFLGASAANFSERSGIVNIAIEGFMISSALSYALFTIKFGSYFYGIIFAILINLFFSLLFAYFTVKLKLNHIVSGVGFNLLIAGLAKFLLVLIFQSSSNSPRYESIPKIPIIENIPTIGNVIGDYIILFSFILIFASNYILFKTRFGLRLRSAGENPEAGESLGVKIRKYKLSGIILCGFLSSLAGIWIASSQNSYSEGMIAGRGYIAIAAMIIGKWTPVNIFYACIMFAFFEALEITLQISGIGIPSQFVQMLPYLITILVLVGFIGKTKPPAADGVPY